MLDTGYISIANTGLPTFPKTLALDLVAGMRSTTAEKTIEKLGEMFVLVPQNTL